MMFDILMNHILFNIFHRSMYQDQHSDSIIDDNINHHSRQTELTKKSAFFIKIFVFAILYNKFHIDISYIRNCRALTIREYLSSLSFFMWKIEKSDRQKLEEKLDRIFSVFIRLRDCDEHWIVHCPLCSRKWHRTESQNMHFRKRTFKKYKFSEINCHAWCEHCNVMLNWNEWAYAIRMIEKYWIEITKQLKFDKSTFKIHTYEFEEMIEHYLECIKELAEEKHQTEYLPKYIKKYLSL